MRDAMLLAWPARHDDPGTLSYTERDFAGPGRGGPELRLAVPTMSVAHRCSRTTICSVELAPEQTGLGLPLSVRHGAPKTASGGKLMQRITITFDDALAEEIDKLVKQRGYQNRSEAVRDLVRVGIVETHPEQRTAECVASVIYVYDSGNANCRNGWAKPISKINILPVQPCALPSTTTPPWT